MTKRRVVLVDDHALFRAGVRSELGDEVDVVAEAGTVDEAVTLIRQTDPDVVLLDVHLPDGGGEAVIAGVAKERPAVRFLALSVSDAADDVIGVIRAGARGYVTKTISGPELIDAIGRVAEGDAVFSPRLAGFVLDAFGGDATAARDEELDHLTAREREVLQLIARGYRYKEIAARLHLPDGGGEAVIAAIEPERPAVKFLALSVSDAADDVIGVIRAGARGYVTKTISGEELTDAIHRVADGDAVFSPRLAGFVLDAFRDGEASQRDEELDHLTAREREVLQLIARGYRYKEIAARLHLSVKTVESHVSAVLRKLQLSSRHELTRWAAKRRLI